MKNVTITMDEEVAHWAKVHAAKMDMSLSKMLGETLREQMGKEKIYDQAMNRFFFRPCSTLRETSEPYPARESLYER